MEVEYETIGPLRIHLENLESQVKEKSETIIKLQKSFDEMSSELNDITEELRQQMHLEEIYTESKVNFDKIT